MRRYNDSKWSEIGWVLFDCEKILAIIGNYLDRLWKGRYNWVYSRLS